MNGDTPARIVGSFRDPDSYVFEWRDGIYRFISNEAYETVQKVASLDSIQALVQKKKIIAANVVGKEERPPGFGEKHVVEHPVLQSITYPYEWSFTMLADAALLQLQIQKECVKAGYTLKDATPFNFQFEQGKVMFIDWGSFDKPYREDIWVAYGQFCRMFLYPLLLHKYKGISFKQVFMADLGGISPHDTYEILGTLRAVTPKCLVDVAMQHYLTSRNVSKTRRVGNSYSDRKGPGNKDVQLMNLDRLERLIKRLSKTAKTDSLWVQYENLCNYAAETSARKRNFISGFLEQYRPSSVVDLGCNTGEYSFLAEESGAGVVAIDSDNDAVEHLYRKSKAQKANILPLVASIASPSPGLGLHNHERLPLSERIKGEAVFALALIHHLVVTANVPLSELGRLFLNYTNRHLILEYVDREDSMFQTLIALRDKFKVQYSLNELIDALDPDFRLIKKELINGTLRVMLHFERRE